jgi:Helix-loop-helix DNA-binding domain
MPPSLPPPTDEHNLDTTDHGSFTTTVESNNPLSAPHKKRKHSTKSTSKSIAKTVASTICPLTPSPDMTGNHVQEHIPVIALPPGMTSDKHSPTPPSSPPRAGSDGSQSPKQPHQYHIADMLVTSTSSQPTQYNPQMPVHPHVIIAGPPHAIYYHPHQTPYYPPISMNSITSQHSEDSKGKPSEDSQQRSNSEKTDSEDSSSAAAKVSGQSQMVSGDPSNMPTFAYLSGQPYSYPTYMMPNGSMSSFPVVSQMSPPLHPSITSVPIGGGRHETTADQREQLRKVSHSAIERRRREKINTKIQQLRQLIPSCADQDHLHKLNILQSAIEYINYLHAVLGSMESQGQNVLESAARTDHRMLALLQHLKRLSPPSAVSQENSTMQPAAVMFHPENNTSITTTKRKRSDELDENETAQQGLLMLSQACVSDEYNSSETKHKDMNVNSLLCDG